MAVEEVGEDLEMVQDGRCRCPRGYGIALIDDDMDDLHECIEKVSRKGCRVVLLSSGKDIDLDGVDMVVTKPFLPSDIVSILSGEDDEEDSVPGDRLFGALDPEDIGIIREILDNDLADEEDGEEEIFSQSMSAEELIDRLLSIKPKRLKRLLAGAEVTISLKFPKD